MAPFDDITRHPRWFPQNQRRRASEYYNFQIFKARRSWAKLRYWKFSNERRAVAFRHENRAARFRLDENNNPEVYAQNDIDGGYGWIPLVAVERTYR